ncbi:MAG TPA: hypothetical protein VGM02_01590 [Acidobacteriaceae bacterium]|jgi:aromatic ring-cleaving dioxygenase
MPAGIRSHTLTKKKRQIFLDSLSEGMTVTAAAKMAGYHRRYMYSVRDENPEFAIEWDDAVQQGLDLLEEEVRRRATGYQEDLVYQGKKTKEQVTRHSDILLMFLMKAKRPEFKDNNKVEIQVGDKLGELMDAISGKAEEPAEVPVSEPTEESAT